MKFGIKKIEPKNFKCRFLGLFKSFISVEKWIYSVGNLLRYGNLFIFSYFSPILSTLLVSKTSHIQGFWTKVPEYSLKRKQCISRALKLFLAIFFQNFEKILIFTYITFQQWKSQSNMITKDWKHFFWILTVQFECHVH